jgi:hypothetical protein
MKACSVAIWATVLAATTLVGGCSLFGSDKDDNDQDVVVTSKTYDGVKSGSAYTYQYIDLEDPDNPASAGTGTAWDIMITAQKEILTNSGVTATALTSGGLGGAVFSGGTDISASLSKSAAVAAFTADTGDGKDYAYWDKYKTTSATPTAAQTGNAISFPGYTTQDGRDGTTAATAWVFGDVGAHVDVNFSLGHSYASWERMTPSYSAFTNNVYYIRSGDGASYYKLQITEAVYTAASSSSDGKTHYTYGLKFAKLN